MTAISVGRDCELVRPDQTVIRVEAELVPDTYSQHLNVSYTLEENEKSNIVHDVSKNKMHFPTGSHFAEKDARVRDSTNLKFEIKFLIFQSNFIKSVQEKNYVFACDGKTFGMIRTHDKALLDRIVQRGKVFARMLPEQKIHLIECMKDLG